jgi:hypothetical protein
MTYLRYWLGICLEELRKPLKSSVRIAGAPAETQTEYLSYPNLEHHC